MGNESIEASFLSIFALISFFIFLLLSKYSHKFGEGTLLDKDFSKPQAFHDLPITRSGGIGIIISLSIFSFVSCILFSPILKTLFCVALLIAEKLNVLVTATILTFCGCGEYLKMSCCTILRFFKFMFVVVRVLIWLLPFYFSSLF